MRTRSRRWLVWILGSLALLLIVLIAIVALIPGSVSVGWRTLPARTAAPSESGQLSQANSGATVDANSATPAADAERGLRITYRVPLELIQREVSAMFPLDENLFGAVRLLLSNPALQTDPDPDWLRLKLDLEVRVQLQNRTDAFPGVGVFRFQLDYDRGTRRVTLAHPQLVEFAFTGEAAAVASDLQPVVASALADEMNGYEVFVVPEGGPWWQRRGASMLQDVTIENGAVTVIGGF